MEIATMKKLTATLAALALTLTLGARRLPLIFETDMGNDIDDALALDILYRYHRQRDIRLMAVMLNKQGEWPPRFIDILNTWYRLPHTPIGLPPRSQDATPEDDNNYTQTVSRQTGADGKPLYPRTVADCRKLPAATDLYRKLLAKARDHSVTIVSVGFSTNLAHLLDTPPDRHSPLDGRQLVGRKVSRLVVMAGHIADTTYHEFNVVGDLPACQHLFRDWPTDIYVSPFELGLQVPYPARSILEDFGWAPHHPVVDAYKAYLPQLEDRPSWDLTAALFAVEPRSDFSVSPPGTLTVTDQGATHFHPHPGGRHHTLSATPEQARRILERLVQKTTSPL